VGSVHDDVPTEMLTPLSYPSAGSLSTPVAFERSSVQVIGGLETVERFADVEQRADLA
jgi:hypothetical protein